MCFVFKLNEKSGTWATFTATCLKNVLQIKLTLKYIRVYKDKYILQNFSERTS